MSAARRSDTPCADTPASMGRDPVMVQCAELLGAGKMPSFAEIKGGKVSIAARLDTPPSARAHASL